MILDIRNEKIGGKFSTYQTLTQLGLFQGWSFELRIEVPRLKGITPVAELKLNTFYGNCNLRCLTSTRPRE